MPSTGTLVFNDQKLQAPEMYATESLGVGVSVPTSNLEVVGNAYVSSNLDVGGSLGLTKGSSLFVGDSVVMETSKHDRPLVKYPEIAMTANSSGGYVVSASGTPNINHSPYHAFNNSAGNTSDSWHSENSYASSGSRESTTSTLSTWTGGGGGHNGAWLKIQLPNKIVLNYILLKQRTAVSGLQHPRLFSIVGSNDDSNWYLVHEETSRAFTGATAPDPDHHIMTGPYASTAWKYFAVVIKTGATDNSYSHVAIGDWELYGYEEGDVSTDVTLSSAYNKPGTEQLEVYYDGQDYTSMPSSVTDKSGNGVTGTPTNVTFDSTWKAFSFDGSGDYIEGTLGNPGGDYVHSVSWWFKPTQTTQAIGTNEQTMWFMGNTWGAGVCSYSSFYADTFYFAWHTYNINCPTTNISQQQWNHACVTYTGGGSSLTSRSIYINGVKQYSSLDNTQGQLLNLPANTYLLLGNQRGQSKYFNGSIANFRLFSKALNAEQVKELYDYQKDYFLGSRSSLTIHKGNLGLGVAEPTSRLEIAGNERIQEYPPRAMTGHDTYMEGHGVFRATASSEYNSTFKAFRAFIENIDNSTSSFWHSQSTYSTASGYNPHTGDQSITAGDGTVYSGEWIQLSMPYQIHLKRIGVSPRTTNYNRGPHTATLLARRNGGDDWVVLTSWGGLVWTTTEASDAVIKYIEVNSEQPYSEFVMVVHLSNDSVNINRMKFFGTPAPSTLDDGHLTLGKQLTTPRVSGHAAGAETPRAESLVVHYDTTVDSVVSGTTVVDTSGNGLNGALENGPTYSSSLRAFQFDGTNDWLSAPINNSGGAWVHSMSFWFKFNGGSAGGLYSLVHIGAGASTQNIMSDVLVYTDGKIRFGFYDNDSDTATGLIDPNIWYHIVCTYNGGAGNASSRLVYINGQSKTLATVGAYASSTLNLAANTDVYLGSQQGNHSFPGSISNFKLWDVALTADEVAAEYALGRTGKALNVTDTAVCLGGTAPRAQLDVRGIATVDRLNIVERLDVNTIARLNHYAGSRSGTFSGSGTFDLPANLDYGYAAAPQIGWEIHMAFGFSGTAGGEFFITGAKDTSGTNVSANEHSHFSIEPNGSTNYGGTCYLTYSAEPVAPVYYAKITIAQPYFNNVPASSNGSVNRIHMMYDCVGCKRMTGASIFRGACYFSFSSSGRRIKYLRLNCTAGTVSGNYMVNALTSEL